MTFNLPTTWYIQVKMRGLRSNVRPKNSFTRNTMNRVMREKKILVYTENGSMYPVPLQGIPGGAGYCFRLSRCFGNHTDKSMSMENLTRGKIYRAAHTA